MHLIERNQPRTFNSIGYCYTHVDIHTSRDLDRLRYHTRGKPRPLNLFIKSRAFLDTVLLFFFSPFSSNENEAFLFSNLEVAVPDLQQSDLDLLISLKPRSLSIIGGTFTSIVSEFIGVMKCQKCPFLKWVRLDTATYTQIVDCKALTRVVLPYITTIDIVGCEALEQLEAERAQYISRLGRDPIHYIYQPRLQILHIPSYHGELSVASIPQLELLNAQKADMIHCIPANGRKIVINGPAHRYPSKDKIAIMVMMLFGHIGLIGFAVTILASDKIPMWRRVMMLPLLTSLEFGVTLISKLFWQNVFLPSITRKKYVENIPFW